jgi:transcriptional regulator with XRE-family HTH domain
MSEQRPGRPSRASARKPRPRSHRKGGEVARRLEAAQTSVGAFLRATRESLKLTQAELAERTRQSPWRLSRAAVSAIERGENFPGLSAMLAFSSVLQIDPKELIERARLAAVVPLDVTGLAEADLEARAAQLFWAGDFKHALAVYDALVHKLALEEPQREEARARLATLEVRRATALKRLGALISALASAERAISLAATLPAIQAEAYVVFSDLQAQRGHLPLASDAAERAVALAEAACPHRLAWALMARGKVRYLSQDYPAAKQAFLVARRQAEAAGDRLHLSHIAGNIGSCCLALSQPDEGREWLERALALAREHGQPALEASWLVELGKQALARGEAAEADRLALEALRIAGPREHELTRFRAEWLRHRVSVARAEAPDAERLALLGELHRKLGDHEGVDEIVDYRQAAAGRPRANGDADAAS